MKEYIPILKKSQLFSGIDESEIISVLSCLDAKVSSFKKGEYILRQGEHINSVILLLEGMLHIQKDDYWGNRSILNRIDAGEMFGEAYAAPESEALLNDVIAVEDSTVVFLDIKRIMTTCSSACRFHSEIIKNLFYAISEKNRKLVGKLSHISKRTTREKLLSYLSLEAEKQNSSSFSIPFNRQQLADYLSVDRSAMSNELCKMRDEGLIEFEKHRFRLM